MEESELRRALRETKNKLREVSSEIRGMVSTLRPEEPIISKTRKIFGNPLRKRIRRRIERYRAKEE